MSYAHVKNSRTRLKERIVYVMGNKCAVCGYDKCLSALELHHLNPSEKDFTISQIANRSWATVRKEIEKCVLVCANCHREIESNSIECPPSSFIEEKAGEIDSLIEDIKKHKIQYCKTCGVEISVDAEYCPSCANIAKRKVERPTREQLKEEIRTISFSELSRKYGVSDNAIRKWCIAYNLPHKKTDIKNFSDSEWATQ